MSIAALRIRKSWLICGAILIPILFAAIGFVYYPALLHSGALPSDGDSIGIPIFTGVFASPILMALLIIYAIPAFYRYDSSASFFAGDFDHPWRFALGWIAYGVPALVILFFEVRDWLSPMPRYEYWWSVVIVPLAAWLILLRAAVSVPREPNTVD